MLRFIFIVFGSVAFVACLNTEPEVEPELGDEITGACIRRVFSGLDTTIIYRTCEHKLSAIACALNLASSSVLLENAACPASVDNISSQGTCTCSKTDDDGNAKETRKDYYTNDLMDAIKRCEFDAACSFTTL